MRKFKTESQKLLDLMINSIYTNKEIFLRELISNASDAVDKLYFRSLTDSSIKLSKSDLEIRVSYDRNERTITVSDNGIGMTKEELDTNLSTIAHSGSMEFKNEAADAETPADIDIIGQFGVGFYSGFMVADKVTVISKAYGSDEANKWESKGTEGYTISPAEKDSYGTDVILHLKEDTEEETYSDYLTEYGLTELIKKYSNYVRYPIKMVIKHRRMLERPEDAGDDYRPEYEDYEELETINSMIPIWKRKKGEVEDEDYNEFYKTNFHDYSDPARVATLHAEGALTYDALLFFPSHAPFDFYSKDYQKGLALYSSGVMIMDKCADLVPDCFSFVRGVVDSQDLSLNISREMLQQDNQLRIIARRLEKKIKSELEDMRDKDREVYEQLFRDFGRTMKYSLYSSYGTNRDLLSDLLLFYSAKQEKMVTLDEYLDGCPSVQDTIYYAAGEDLGRLAKMPIVTTVLEKGHDVLLCTADVDEFAFMAIGEYKEHVFKNVAGGDLDLSTPEEKEAAEAANTENAELFEAMQEALGEKVTKVAVSTRISDAPACITAQGPVSLEMERVLSREASDQEVRSERVLELNANHDIFKTLQKAKEEGDDEKIALYADLLYNQALLVEGLDIEDPVAFAKAVCQLMV